jgi:hypothetical protein
MVRSLDCVIDDLGSVLSVAVLRGPYIDISRGPFSKQVSTSFVIGRPSCESHQRDRLVSNISTRLYPGNQSKSWQFFQSGSVRGYI